MFLTDWTETLGLTENAKILCRLIFTSILEEVSFTRKDGQYLRWDTRSEKLQERNKSRLTQGKKEIKGIDKGILPSVREAFLAALDEVIGDIENLQKKRFPQQSNQRLIEGSTLFVLPMLDKNIYSGVITSPPYLNRYDYTRTYALELAYLGVGERINTLRQTLLSCTVENKSKIEQLRDFYESQNLNARFQNIYGILETNKALQEVNNAMKTRWERGDLNNKGVLKMVKQYFLELGFIFAELHRVCRSGAMVAFVNDNTRYGGEIIPVDTITTNIAESLGFEPVNILVLPQKKGNSSQQMGKFGREELRKCITVWRKP
jgi:site-specific DNA-methyltransferase (cytosine-N4-specific)